MNDLLFLNARPAAVLSESSDFAHTIISSAQEGIIVYDRQLRYRLWNPFMEQLTGLAAEAVLGHPALESFPHLRQNQVDQLLERALAGETVSSRETPFCLPETGRSGWVISTYAPHRNHDAEIIGVVAVVRDVTGRKQAEAEQAACAERVRQQQAAIIALACHEAIVRGQVNEAARVIARTMAETMVIERAAVWLLDEAMQELRCAALYVRSRAAFLEDVPVRRADYPRYFAALEAGRAIDATEACTDGRTSEFAESYLQPLGIVSLLDSPIRLEGRVVGMVCHEQAGALRRWHPDEIRMAAEASDQMALALLNAKRKHARDELTKSEERLQERETLISAVLRSSPYLIHVLDLDQKNFLYSNKRLPELLGYSASETLALKDDVLARLIHPEDAPKLQTHLAKMAGADDGEIHSFEFRMKRKAADYSWFLARDTVFRRDVSGRVQQILSSARDITETKQAGEAKAKLEAQLFEAQKMEAIGTLAGGIAHDFNNILCAIFGNIELARLEASENAVLQEYLDELYKASIRAKDLVAQILTFSRRHSQERTPVQIQLVIREVLKLLRATLPSTIVIAPCLEAADVVVLADASQLHQVMMNLCANAAYAMSKQGGRLEVRLTCEDLDVEFCQSHSGLRSGPHVRLVVSDTGCGIEPAHLSRIFEPFFTTKPAGTGTGLGLAVVHGIIQSHQGAITVYSEVGRGTTFHIFLPRVEDKRAELTPAGAAAPGGHGERILLIDDEPALVLAIGGMLKRLGYDVTTPKTSLAALEEFRQDPARFDLVITDQTMPHLTGSEVAARFLAIRPELPIILATGNAGRVNQPELKAIGIHEILSKPITYQELAQAVQRALRHSRVG